MIFIWPYSLVGFVVLVTGDYSAVIINVIIDASAGRRIYSSRLGYMLQTTVWKPVMPTIFFLRVF